MTHDEIKHWEPDEALFVFSDPNVATLNEIKAILQRMPIIELNQADDDEEDIGFRGNIEDAIDYLQSLLTESLDEHKEDQKDDPEQMVHFLVMVAEEDPRMFDIVERLSFTDHRGRIFYTLCTIQQITRGGYVVWYS